MYILKNALKNILRSPGRTVLMFLIVTVTAASCCIASSIRRSAGKVREQAMEEMDITAAIRVDRAYIMKSLQSEGVDMRDRAAMQEAMSRSGSLDEETLRSYSQEDCVRDFYYVKKTAVNGSEGLIPVSDGSGSSVSAEAVSAQSYGDGEIKVSACGGEVPGMPDPPEGYTQEELQQMMEEGIPPEEWEKRRQESETRSGPEQGTPEDMPMGDTPTGDTQQAPQEQQDPAMMLKGRGELMLTGYSSERAMGDFIDGVCTVTEGNVFSFEGGQGTAECLISEELAAYNSLSVGDSLWVCDPRDEEVKTELKVAGLYKNSGSAQGASGSTSEDEANDILMSANDMDRVLAAFGEKSEEGEPVSVVSGSYILGSMEDYDRFESVIAERDGGRLVLTSSEVAGFESSLLPLNDLKSFAGTFLVIMLIVGTAVLAVVNILSVRERKYEIGVLTSVGMTKAKVAMQFMTEIFITTAVSITVGTAAGAAASVPLTSKLLEDRIAVTQEQSGRVEQNFGRSGQMAKGGDIEGEINYISEIPYSTDGSVVVQMAVIGLGLTVISGAAAVLFVMRYRPLKILSDRD